MHNTTSCNTQFSAPEDGHDQRPKHVELIGIINKPSLLRLVGVYVILTKAVINLNLEKQLPVETLTQLIIELLTIHKYWNKL